MSSKKQPRDQVSARLDPEVLEVVQHVADAERRPISSVVGQDANAYEHMERATVRRSGESMAIQWRLPSFPQGLGPQCERRED